jgi:hypothetical protein
MRTLLLTAIRFLVALAGVASAIPEEFASAPKISGSVTQISSSKDGHCTAFYIKLEEPFDRDLIRKIHNALAQNTRLDYRDYRRPKSTEALLLFEDAKPKGIVVGDRIVIHNYAVMGHSESSRKDGIPIYSKIEKLPPK